MGRYLHAVRLSDHPVAQTARATWLVQCAPLSAAAGVDRVSRDMAGLAVLRALSSEIHRSRLLGARDAHVSTVARA